MKKRKAKIDIDLIISDDNWKSYVFKENQMFYDVTYECLEHLHNKDIDIIEFSVDLSNDKNITVLNNEYRGKDKPTNVLSFPANQCSEGMIEAEDIIKTADGNYVHLGDIIISLETLYKEAEEQGKSFNDHLTHLFLHSVLHLIGYDHEEKAMQNRMEKIEIEILKKFGINCPYE